MDIIAHCIIHYRGNTPHRDYHKLYILHTKLVSGLDVLSFCNVLIYVSLIVFNYVEKQRNYQNIYFCLFGSLVLMKVTSIGIIDTSIGLKFPSIGIELTSYTFKVTSIVLSIGIKATSIGLNVTSNTSKVTYIGIKVASIGLKSISIRLKGTCNALK